MNVTNQQSLNRFTWTAKQLLLLGDFVAATDHAPTHADLVFSKITTFLISIISYRLLYEFEQTEHALEPRFFN